MTLREAAANYIIGAAMSGDGKPGDPVARAIKAMDKEGERVKPKTTTTTTIKKKTTITLCRADLIEILRRYSGLKIPVDAEAHVRVPGGGDWSNTDLFIDDLGEKRGVNIYVTWTEETRNEDTQ